MAQLRTFGAATLGALLLLRMTGTALAVGSDSDAPPAPSETTTVCAEGLVWDLATKTCLPPDQSTNDDTAMRETVRELAYVGRYADAGAVLDLLPEDAASFVHTYRGFIARQTGDFPTARIEYETAIAIDPANFLARSYYGQGLFAAGEVAAAEAQLVAIRLGGGSGTWAERSLADTLEGKPSPFY